MLYTQCNAPSTEAFDFLFKECPTGQASAPTLRMDPSRSIPQTCSLVGTAGAFRASVRAHCNEGCILGFLIRPDYTVLGPEPAMPPAIFPRDPPGARGNRCYYSVRRGTKWVESKRRATERTGEDHEANL